MKTVKKMGMGGMHMMPDGSMMKDSMMKKGGAVKAKKQVATAIAMKAAGKKPKMATGGALKDVPAGKEKSLGQLPTKVREKMGFKKHGGSTDPKMKMGGAIGKAKMGGSMKGKKC